MESVFSVRKNKERAKSLLKAAETRLQEMNKIRKLVSKERIVEIYYDSAKEDIIAIMYMDGFKTTSHVEMINYLREKYPEIGQVRIALLDELRQKRNAISYYGESIGESFLAQKEEEIKDAIEEIKKKAKSKL